MEDRFLDTILNSRARLQACSSKEDQMNSIPVWSTRLLGWITVLLVGCGSGTPSSSTPTPTAASSKVPGPSASPGSASIPSSWAQIHSFAIQLQGLNLKVAQQSPFDLLICDYSKDGSDGQAYTRKEVDALRLRPGSPRKVVAYLSVGEAESYRFYWKPSYKPGAPVWLGPTNPEWGGNYKVHYWDPQWQSIVFGYADKILDNGFDGLFLDVVDAYEFWEKKRPTAAEDMKRFVTSLSEHVRARSGKDVGIFLNGGGGLAADSRFLQNITGVVKEEIFFGLGGDGKVTPKETTQSCLNQLKPVVDSGRLVLSIDYTTNQNQVLSAHQQARSAGYLEYVGVRNLDRLNLKANSPQRN